MPTLGRARAAQGAAVIRRDLLTTTLLFLACLHWPAPVGAAALHTVEDLTPIAAIQGNGAASPRVGQTVTVLGRVTGVTATGFFLQDAVGDDDPATSDGIFVYTRTAPAVAPGSCVRVQDAQVVEFYARTELNRSRQITASDACPAAAVTPVTATWQTPGDAALVWERLEGMLVRLAPAAGVVHGPTRRYASGEVEIALLDARRTDEAGLERLFQHATVDGVPVAEALLFLSNRLGASLPAVHWGDRMAGAADGWVGIVDYHFGKYQLILLADQTVVAAPHTRSIALPPPARDDDYSICTVNVHGLGRGAQQLYDPDRYTAALARHAATIAGPLQGCTIVALQETGTPDDAAALAATLAAQFDLPYTAAALPGPASRDPEFPLTNSLLVRSDRVRILALAQVQGCSARDHGLVAPDACVAGTFPLFDRPPLAAQLEVDGPWESPQQLWVINNHWKSKTGDERANALLRGEQAGAVARYVAELVVDVEPRVIVLGDLNDFSGGPALAVAQAALTPPLLALLDLAPWGDRYTYLFNGAAQALDHVLASANLGGQIAGIYPVHINADFADPGTDADAFPAAPWQRSSDHDPILVHLRPAGAAGLGGALHAAAVGVTAVNAQGETVATALSDANGEFRLWGIDPGPLTLHLDAPPGIQMASATVTVTAVAGYQEVAAPSVTFTSPAVAHWLALRTPDLAAYIWPAQDAP